MIENKGDSSSPKDKDIKNDKKQETPAQPADGQEKSKDSNDKQKKDEEKKIDSEEKNLNPSNKKDFLELFKIASSPKLNQKDFQKVLDFGVELRTQNKITERQFQNLKVLVEKRLELEKTNKKIEEMNKNYAKRFGGFMPSKEWQEAPPAGVPIPPGFDAEMNFKTDKKMVRWNDPYEGMPAKEKEGIRKLLNEKQGLEEELRLKRDLKEKKAKDTSRKGFSEAKREKEENKTSKGEQGPTYQEILQEIRKAEGKKDFPKDNKEKDEAGKRLGELEKKREEYTLRARREGFFKDLEERTGGIREMTERGKYFSADLIRESRASITDPEGTPKELRGIRQDYYQREILKILREKSIPEDPKKQEEILREYLKVLRTGRLAPELITSNPLWIEMTSMIPYFKPELQEEFKARFEIFRYALGFKVADGVESGISGASHVLLSHIGKAFKVPEIQKAYDLLEESSQITKEEIMQRDNVSNDKAKEKIGKENPLYAGTEEQKKVVLGNLALKLAKVSGEKTESLNDKKKEELKEKYMWAVEEADDVWRITFRSDESDIGMEGKGGQWYLNRLFHYGARLKSKGFGYESTRKYFNKPFFPEEIAPSKKGEARGLMMQGLWEYQIDYLKIAGLEDLEFKREGGREHIYYGEDGNGRELPYVIYKKEFKAPDGKSKEMEVKMSVDKKGKYTNVIEVANLSAEILSKICEKVPEGFYGSYVGDWIIKAENTKKLLEGGVLKFPPGSEENIRRLLSELQSKKIFDHLDPLSKDKGRKPGKYYQEDAWEDLIRGAVDFGLHEGKQMFEPWKIWGAWRAGVLTKAATDFKVITDEQGSEIENEMLPFLGMRGNIPRLLRCNFDRYTMVFRWGPMRAMLLGEMIKQFFEGIFQGLPSAPSKKR